MRIVRLLLCIVGLFVHCHKTQNRIQSRCDVGLHVCKYNGPTAKSILFIYVMSHRVTFCEKASFRKLALVLLSKVKVGFLRPVQQPGSYWDRSSQLPLVGLEPTEVTAYD